MLHRVMGKSKGYRTIILIRRREKAFFVFGFSKSQRANIDDDEERQQGGRKARAGVDGVEAARRVGEKRGFYGGQSE